MLPVLLIILAQASLVSCKFHCVGTCYSGETFPLPKDIVNGKHMKGHSYKNITTNDPKKCYSSCINDCRCKACQMKGARCELLDKDHTSKPKDFVAKSGYVYYDLKQEFYKGKSHMFQPEKCSNGCCRFQACMNGGTCVEHCDTPKEKFSCTCTTLFTGTVCQRKVASCMDYLRKARGATPRNGKYVINSNGVPLEVFCDFHTTNQAWTLIESFKTENRLVYKTLAFHTNSERNPNSVPFPFWDDYRLSLSKMKFLSTKASMFRATCNFPIRGAVRSPDFLFGYKSDYDIINKGETNECVKYAYINVRGHESFNKTAKTWQTDGQFHFHMAPNKLPCTFEIPDPQAGEEFFGYYAPPPIAITNCTATPQSTTQWWLGEQK